MPAQGVIRAASRLYFKSLLGQGLSANKALLTLRSMKSPLFPSGMGYNRALFLSDWAVFKGTANLKQHLATMEAGATIPEKLIPQMYMKVDNKYKWIVEMKGYNEDTKKRESIFRTIYSDRKLTTTEAEQFAGDMWLTEMQMDYKSNIYVDKTNLVEAYRHKGYK